MVKHIHAGEYDDAYGGAGSDVLTGVYLSGLYGGRGDDELRANGSGNAEGGPGHDHIHAAKGLVTVYLKDGTRDRVSCSGDTTKIYVGSRDKHDRIAGDCERF